MSYCIRVPSRFRYVIAAWIGMLASSVASAAYTALVQAVLRAKCLTCHGQDSAGGVRLDALTTDLVADRAAGETWQEALHVIQRGDMPPEESPPLLETERTLLSDWIGSLIERAENTEPSKSNQVRIRRLNRVEYQNTMTELLGLDIDYVRDFPADSLSPDGFRNDGEALQMSPLQLEYYLETARRALPKIIVDGERPENFEHTFTESNVASWRGPTHPSKTLGRSQTFLATIKDDYPGWGDFRIRVHLQADIKPDAGFPILKVSLGFRPDTELVFRAFDPVELTSTQPQVIEFRGRIETFPLPERGRGKFPGLVIRLQNIYDDGSPRPKPDGKRKGFVSYPDEPDLPTLLVDRIEFDGPVIDQWPPERHRRLLPEPELRTSNPYAYVRQILQSFLTRAYRRPVHDDQLRPLLTFFDSIRLTSDTFEEAFRETLALVLIRPEFLYRMEQRMPAERLDAQDDFALASRLSYFLWSTMPDERLFELAGEGTLNRPKVLRQQVRRMLADGRSNQFIEQFVDQWLQLDRMYSVAINPDYYPEFDDGLKQHFAEEARSFVRHQLQSGGSVSDLLASQLTMLNESLARHYGVDGVYGLDFRPVDLSGTKREGGILGQGGILLANSTGEDSHAVRRAVWVRDRLLGDPPKPPPPDVPPLDEAEKRFHQLSVREQLRIHGDAPACKSCHTRLDPFGVALEHYDAVGRWRDEIVQLAGKKRTGHPVEASDVLPGGIRFDGAESLRQYIVTERHDDFVRSFVERLLTYSLRRELTLADQFGGQTRFRSLALSSDGGVGEPTRSSTFSFDRHGRPVPALNSPRQVFDRLFGAGDERTVRGQRRIRNTSSMLDQVLEDSRSLSLQLGTADRRKFEEHLDAVRHTEKEVDRVQRWLDIPKPKLSDEDRETLQLDADDQAPDRFIRVMYDLLLLAFRTDSTRIATYQIASMNGAASLATKFPQLLDFKNNLHKLAHNWNKPGGAEELGRWDRYLASHLARFLQRLDSVPEDDGTLLDHTTVLYGSSNSNTHNNRNYPLILADGRSMNLAHGSHRKFDESVPMSNLFVTLLN